MGKGFEIRDFGKNSRGFLGAAEKVTVLSIV